MNLMSLAELLEDAGLGRKGKSIFLNKMPLQAERAILLRTPLRGIEIDYELPGYYRAGFQLIARGRAYAETERLIKQAIAVLTLSNVEVGSMHFNFCRPQTLPVSFPLSEGNLIEFSVNFDASYVEV